MPAGSNPIRVRITQLADGTALLVVAAWKENVGEDAEGLLYASRDEGETWAGLGSLGPRCARANLLELRSGELLAAITYRGGRKEGDPAGEVGREELFHNITVAPPPTGERPGETTGA